MVLHLADSTIIGVEDLACALEKWFGTPKKCTHRIYNIVFNPPKHLCGLKSDVFLISIAHTVYVEI